LGGGGGGEGGVQDGFKLTYKGAHINLAYLYQRNEKNYKMAIEHYLLSGYDDKAVMYNLGILYYKIDNMELAEKYLISAYEKKANIQTIATLGWFYKSKKVKKYDLAIKYYSMINYFDKVKNKIIALEALKAQEIGKI